MTTALSGFGLSAMPYGILLAAAVAEFVWPGRDAAGPVGRRWFGNLSLHVLSSGLFMLPMITALLAAIAAQSMGPGLLGLLRLPAALHAVLALLALDAVSYTTHRLSHAIPPLWRLHAVHHSDAEVDATTTLRHHPLEALTGAVLSSGAVLILGISPAEVAAYVAAEWAVQSLAHANVALPPRWERVLRRIVVTPGFHQLHHSRERAETDSNYGQVLTIWDDLLRTASSRPVGAPRIEFGLDAFRDPKFQNPHWLLAQPALRQNAVPPGQPEVRLAP